MEMENDIFLTIRQVTLGQFKIEANCAIRLKKKHKLETYFEDLRRFRILRYS
jgi:hypothetical protein